MLRPVVRVSLADASIIVGALVDTGSEHVVADASLAVAAGIDLPDPIDIEEIGLGGVVHARFVPVGSVASPTGGRRFRARGVG